MHITRLRLLGFKSFVDPTELIVEKGLTGVVGPNGCGKSNLLEALRWVMGETSYKSMRGGAMDDVIFSGTNMRPARNSAEVMIFLDNSKRAAPANFNDSDVIEIVRRIEREAGSAYKINGKDARARDVQLLFADASTGARSPALVQQGRIGEIVNSKPQARRRILEEAAGITGLHSRRHEAELRLRAAEGNLERLQDIIGQIGSQLASLKRQARQAIRYKELSTHIQQAEAVQFHLNWIAAGELVTAEENKLQEAMREVGTHTQAESAAMRAHAECSEVLQPLRDEEAKCAAILHRLEIERDALDKEEARANDRVSEIKSQLEQLERDLVRERDLIDEAKDVLERLAKEEAEIQGSISGQSDVDENAGRTLEAAKVELNSAETQLSDITAQAADTRARRRQAEQVATEQITRISQLEQQTADIERQLENISQSLSDQSEFTKLRHHVEHVSGELARVEQETLAAEQENAAALEEEQLNRTHFEATKLRARELETEVQTLIKLLRPSSQGNWPPIVDQLQVEPGYELALGAALGDDLDAPSNQESPVHWSLLSPEADDGTLPFGATPLSNFVQCPAQLSRRLAQIGIIERSLGKSLQHKLKPGQRLVSMEGDFWRWDGYVAAADAPTAAAKRLSERNRLAALEQEAEQSRTYAESANAEHQKAVEAARQAQEKEKRLREAWRQRQAELTKARDELAAAERQAQESNERRAGLLEAKARLIRDLDEAKERKINADAACAALISLDEIERRLEEQQKFVSEKRTSFSDAQAVVAGLEREARLREQRTQAILEERQRWQNRSKSAEVQIENLKQRAEKMTTELVSLKEVPGQLSERRNYLLSEIGKSEQTRQKAADALAEAENNLRQCDKDLRAIQSQLSNAREERARIEARLEAARERRAEQARQIRDALSCAPEDCLKLANLAEGASLPKLSEIESRLVKLKADRERLGGVNLRAEEEATELSEQVEEMNTEKEDLEQAIARLRQGISSLNREGRKRLLDAFDDVNEHFRRLFTVLFGGGEAELQLVESDDPLEAGLEILAKPPGKKPQVLTLLSGGEKALTALSLIFAVFLTNPSPICVLDEVDAPLDDSNVDRFCRMMEEMAGTTDTRFLVITHHPMTMSRMDRLFGVTMGERGVSQLLSVDLETAEGFREAS